jgi:hypothetical protein
MIIINTKEELIKTLKEFKEEGLKQGAEELSLYPCFCKFLEDNKDKITVNLPKPLIYDNALNVFLGLNDE